MRKRKTNEEFLKEVKEIYGDEYTVLDDYITESTKIRVLHNKCKRIMYTIPMSFLKGSNICLECSGMRKQRGVTKTTDVFRKEILEKTNEYLVLGDYHGSNSKILFKHNLCKNEFSMTPANFLQGQRCPFCFNSDAQRKTKEEVQETINLKLGPSYKLISEYKNNHSKIQVFHESCSNVWNTTLRDIKFGNRCPFCTVMSKGEERIFNFLKENNISATYQFKDDRCRKKKRLPFDFRINGTNILIEYDGVFHYKNVYGEKILNAQQENDLIKTEFATKNGFELIRIKDSEFNDIETILDKIIKRIKKIKLD